MTAALAPVRPFKVQVFRRQVYHAIVVPLFDQAAALGTGIHQGGTALMAMLPLCSPVGDIHMAVFAYSGVKITHFLSLPRSTLLFFTCPPSWIPPGSFSHSQAPPRGRSVRTSGSGSPYGESFFPDRKIGPPALPALSCIDHISVSVFFPFQTASNSIFILWVYTLWISYPSAKGLYSTQQVM